MKALEAIAKEDYRLAYRFVRGWYNDNYGEIPDWSTVMVYAKVPYTAAACAISSFEDSMYSEITHYGNLHLLLKLGRLPF